MPYKPISDYGIIGDMHSAALVGTDGSIDWLCFPRFDSPSVFAAILDDERGGRFRLQPTGHWQSQQRYLPDTNILETAFTTQNGEVSVTDFMPIDEDPTKSRHDLLRIVRGLRGSVELECFFQPRLDYARGETLLRIEGRGAVAEKEEAKLALGSPVPLALDGGAARATFTVDEGDELVFELRWGLDHPPSTIGWRDLEFTSDTWRDVANDHEHTGLWSPEVRRSLLALHLMLYFPTGALIAAPTTSLPEWIGGDRNWDYRFCWIRDAAFTLDVMHRLGHIGETKRFMEWLTQFCASCGDRLQPLYGVRYEELLGEMELDHLEGYRGSRPVRIGNAAAAQLQLDIFGEVMIACATFYRAGGVITDAMWTAIESFARATIDNWRRKDRGVWEVRGPQQHFVFSKLMCWVALDRAITLAEGLGRDAPLDLWRDTKEQIRQDIETHGWNDEIQSYVQYYGAAHTDASLLIMPMVGYIDANDPRMRSTVRRIREELETDGLLRRYPTDRTDDGCESEEGIFTMCTLWLIGDLIFTGELDEAQRLFQRVLDCGNHLGLFSEMINPVTGESLGNFPQAFTHISIIHTARNLDLALSQREELPHEEARIGEPRQRGGVPS